MARPIVVIDLDGTLADTNRDLIPVLNRTIATQGLAPLAFSDVGHIVGHGAKAMLVRAFQFRGVQIDEALLELLFARFLEDYWENISVSTVLFDGVTEALDRLAADGFLLSICTNKTHRMAEKLLRELGVRHRFASVTGGDSYAFRKPDPRHLFETIALAGGDPARAVMVGDSRTDIDTAKAAGIPVVAVDFGYSDVPVALLSPDAVISHYRDLPEHALRLAGAKFQAARPA